MGTIALILGKSVAVVALIGGLLVAPSTTLASDHAPALHTSFTISAAAGLGS
jgi:hypothetical protein